MYVSDLKNITDNITLPASSNMFFAGSDDYDLNLDFEHTVFSLQCSDVGGSLFVFSFDRNERRASEPKNWNGLDDVYSETEDMPAFTFNISAVASDVIVSSKSETLKNKKRHFLNGQKLQTLFSED